MLEVKHYMEICSEKTLQSNSRGFFLQFAEKVREAVDKQWLVNVFGKFKTDRERIRCIFYDPKVKDVVLTTLSFVQEIYRKKSADVSLARRLEAQRLLQTNDVHKALMLLSQAILRAPKTHENLAVDAGLSLCQGLWARSELLMRVNKYELALKDVQFAIKEGLPQTHKAEAYWRMAICYKALHDDKKSHVSQNLALNLLKDMEGAAHVIEESLRKHYTNISNPHTARRRLENIEENPVFPGASRKITIKQDPKKGRFVVAKEYVKSGEVLVQECAYASCLLPECFGAYCHHCYDRLEAPVGCLDCSSIAFCSILCRDKAMATYHKFECHFLDLLIGSGMSILAHVALRMVTQSSIEYMLQVHKDMENGSAKGVYNLCTLREHRNAEDFLQRTVMSGFLLRCLQKSGYFGYRDDKVVPNENQLKIGEILLYNLQMLQFNAHEIYESKLTRDHRFEGCVANYIAVAVYPAAAMFNHSCTPSVTRHFVGRHIVLRTCRPVKPGEEIAENYGPNFSRKALKDRQHYLKGRYWFDCRCIACLQNWPMLDKLKEIAGRVTCPNGIERDHSRGKKEKCCDYFFTLPLKTNKPQCPRCGERVNMSSLEEEYRMTLLLFDRAVASMDSQNIEDGVKCCCKGLDSFYRISCGPQFNAQLAEECLRALFADSGNILALPTMVNNAPVDQMTVTHKFSRLLSNIDDPVKAIK